jgi:hypothetical protein
MTEDDDSSISSFDLAVVMKSCWNTSIMLDLVILAMKAIGMADRDSAGSMVWEKDPNRASRQQVELHRKDILQKRGQNEAGYRYAQHGHDHQ